MPPRTAIVTETVAALNDDPRAAVFEHFADWLTEHHAATLGLPPCEVVAELVRGATLRGALHGSAGAVGAYVISCNRRYRFGLADDYRVLVALGSVLVDRTEDDWASRLMTLPHELYHVGEFFKTVGATPYDAYRAGAMRKWVTYLQEHPESHEMDDPCEVMARELTDAYLRAHPDKARMPHAAPRRKP